MLPVAHCCLDRLARCVVILPILDIEAGSLVTLLSETAWVIDLVQARQDINAILTTQVARLSIVETRRLNFTSYLNLLLEDRDNIGLLRRLLNLRLLFW